ncbi:hypothetical protein BCEN4_530100 [Burkholderia cenocepacia]|nr:hypothetical protein BCEN4_530100 [Burkholderia cenocepacia]
MSGALLRTKEIHDCRSRHAGGADRRHADHRAAAARPLPHPAQAACAQPPRHDRRRHRLHAVCDDPRARVPRARAEPHARGRLADAAARVRRVQRARDRRVRGSRPLCRDAFSGPPLWRIGRRRSRDRLRHRPRRRRSVVRRRARVGPVVVSRVAREPRPARDAVVRPAGRHRGAAAHDARDAVGPVDPAVAAGALRGVRGATGAVGAGVARRTGRPDGRVAARDRAACARGDADAAVPGARAAGRVGRGRVCRAGRDPDGRAGEGVPAVACGGLTGERNGRLSDRMPERGIRRARARDLRSLSGADALRRKQR